MLPLDDGIIEAEDLATRIEDHIASLAPVLRDVTALKKNRLLVMGCLTASILLYISGVLSPILFLPCSNGGPRQGGPMPLSLALPSVLLLVTSILFACAMGVFVAVAWGDRPAKGSISNCLQYVHLQFYHSVFGAYHETVIMRDDYRSWKMANVQRLLEGLIRFPPGLVTQDGPVLDLPDKS